MLRFVTGGRSLPHRLHRREWLRIGGWGSLGLLGGVTTLPHARAESTGRSASSPGFGRAKSVILVYASGGQSQLETWDPKPHAPDGIRGEFQAIPTVVPGTLVTEHMPRLARLADRYTIIRNVSHDDLDHGSASYLALTGHFHKRKSSNPSPSPEDYPTYGAILARVRPSSRFPHTAVHINGPAYVPKVIAPGQDGGFLGRSYEPLLVGDVTAELQPIPGLEPLPELPPVRHDRRRSLLASLEQYCREMEEDRPGNDMQQLYSKAFELLANPRCREAFDLQAEPAAVRDRYGRHRSGQACLLARRLVEAGVPFITVIWNHTNRGQDDNPNDTNVYGWDTHNDIFDALKTHLLPRFDASFSALLEDLDARGLLDETLVICMGEFGRAPRVALERNFAGTSPGRKHWASVYSVVMAGAGVARGKVVGASDAIAAHPAVEPVGPWDIAATAFAALGVDPAGLYEDAIGRPFPITTGRPIRDLYTG